MDLISQIVERAKANKQRIVLPEGTEERTLKAANQILTDRTSKDSTSSADLNRMNEEFHSSLSKRTQTFVMDTATYRF